MIEQRLINRMKGITEKDQTCRDFRLEGVRQSQADINKGRTLYLATYQLTGYDEVMDWSVVSLKE